MDNYVCRYYQHNPTTGECQNCDQPESAHGHDNKSPSHNHQIGGNHYLNMSIQPIDAMKAWSESPMEAAFEAHCRLTAIKYLARAGHKDEYETDIAKARQYLDFILGDRDD